MCSALSFGRPSIVVGKYGKEDEIGLLFPSPGSDLTPTSSSSISPLSSIAVTEPSSPPSGGISSSPPNEISANADNYSVRGNKVLTDTSSLERERILASFAYDHELHAEFFSSHSKVELLLNKKHPNQVKDQIDRYKKNNALLSNFQEKTRPLSSTRLNKQSSDLSKKQITSSLILSQQSVEESEILPIQLRSIPPSAISSSTCSAIAESPSVCASPRELNSTTRQNAGNWYFAGSFIVFSHLVVICLVLAGRGASFSIILLTVLQSWLNLLGITAGVHRLWSHRSYTACAGLRIFLAIIGLQSFQGSIYWWAMRHRLHHRFTDTPNDPYDSRRGLYYSHMGWLFQPPPHFSKMCLIAMKDLEDDKIVQFQKKYLLWAYLLFGLFLPAWLGHVVSNDYIGGILYIGVVARFISWHCIWSINSISHYVGEKNYSVLSSAVHCWWLSFLQNGEGHHNYHHQFPTDYRHGINWYDYDPTKWCINLWVKLGLASRTKTTPTERILLAEIKTLQENINCLRKQNPAVEPLVEATNQSRLLNLPVISMDLFDTQTKAPHHQPWIIVDNLVIDAGSFVDHPGGQALLRAQYGRDATNLFHGNMANHTEAANWMMKLYAIARIKS